jgi:hypothetical protein
VCMELHGGHLNKRDIHTAVPTSLGFDAFRCWRHRDLRQYLRSASVADYRRSVLVWASPHSGTLARKSHQQLAKGPFFGSSWHN